MILLNLDDNNLYVANFCECWLLDENCVYSILNACMIKHMNVNYWMPIVFPLCITKLAKSFMLHLQKGQKLKLIKKSLMCE